MQSQEMSTKLEEPRKYVPAAGKDWSLPLYDPLCKLFGIDSDRKQLISQADIKPDHCILDIGCGTGTLIRMIRRLYPDTEVVGLDPDPKALLKAKKKTAGTGGTVRFDRGFSDALPYPSSSFDLVFSSYMLHHMSEKEKEETLIEVRRVLKAQGSFHLLDLEHQTGRKRHIFSTSAQHIALMKKAEFANIQKVAQKNTLFGLMAYYKATVS